LPAAALHQLDGRLDIRGLSLADVQGPAPPL
jgi:hypothetical protein